MKYTLYALLFTGSLFGGMIILLEVPVIIYTCWIFRFSRGKVPYDCSAGLRK
jgi:hypothetical protein